MKRRVALQILLSGTGVAMWNAAAWSEATKNRPVTSDEKGSFIFADTGKDVITIEPPRVYTIEFGKEIETLKLKWRNKTVSIPIEEVWGALEGK